MNIWIQALFQYAWHTLYAYRSRKYACLCLCPFLSLSLSLYPTHTVRQWKLRSAAIEIQLWWHQSPKYVKTASWSMRHAAVGIAWHAICSVWFCHLPWSDPWPAKWRMASGLTESRKIVPQLINDLWSLIGDRWSHSAVSQAWSIRVRVKVNVIAKCVLHVHFTLN